MDQVLGDEAALAKAAPLRHRLKRVLPVLTWAAVAWHMHSGSLRKAESIIVRVAHVCILAASGEKAHRRTWRRAKQFVIESRGGPPATLIAERAVRGVQRCTRRSACCVWLPCGPSQGGIGRDTKVLGAGLGEPRWLGGGTPRLGRTGLPNSSRKPGATTWKPAMDLGGPPGSPCVPARPPARASLPSSFLP